MQAVVHNHTARQEQSQPAPSLTAPVTAVRVSVRGAELNNVPIRHYVWL